MRQGRREVRQLRATAKTGDLGSAWLLLMHSVAYGHKRLSVRRYLFARALGVPNLDGARPFCRLASQGMIVDDLIAVARSAVRASPMPTGPFELIADLVGLPMPLLMPYGGCIPKLATDPRACGRQACIIGRVEIGSRLVISAQAVIRGDGHFVRIGDDFSIGKGSTVHIAHDVLPTIIGDRVAVGEGACIHACEVGNDCIIGNGVVILDGAKVGDNVVIEDGAVVFPRTKLESGCLYAGMPARAVRRLDEGEDDRWFREMREASAESIVRRQPADIVIESSKANFIAPTATLRGRVGLAPQASVFFSCFLDATDGEITLGRATNIQDNTHIDCRGQRVVIGDRTTIGHNVTIHDSQVGSRCLIGIGATLNRHTIVEDDVLLAAGAETEPGQRLASGGVWGGRPARLLGQLDDEKRSMMERIIGNYTTYADTYKPITNAMS